MWHGQCRSSFAIVSLFLLRLLPKVVLEGHNFWRQKELLSLRRWHLWRHDIGHRVFVHDDVARG